MTQQSRHNARPTRKLTADEAIEILLNNLRRSGPSPKVMALIEEMEADLAARRQKGKHARPKPRPAALSA